MKRAIIALTAVGIASSASAEAVTVIQNEYEPLVSTRQGRIETCGYGFNTIVRAVNGRMYFVTGSANTNYPEKRIPFVLIKVRVFAGGGPDALLFSSHVEAGEGEALFRHACAMNLEGIVSKRLEAPYRSGLSQAWRKIKCPGYSRP